MTTTKTNLTILQTEKVPFSDLPEPQDGHLTESHLRIVLFYGETVHDTLGQAGEYIYDNDLDEYVASIELGIDADDERHPYILSVLLEAAA
jgi:hypothetical protein